MRFVRWCCFLFVLGCASRSPARLELARNTSGVSQPEVRYRPQEAPAGFAAAAIAAVPGSTWDGGLRSAVDELLSLATNRSFSLDPATTSLVAARAGYPGQARFAWVVNDGELPTDLLGNISTRGGSPVNLAIGRRQYGDGTTLWMLAYAYQIADIYPLPRDLELDQPVNIRVEVGDGVRCQLFIRPPDGPIQRMSLSNGVSRWVDRFHVPGEYRIEVVADDGNISRVVLLFSVFVDMEPPAVDHLRPVPMQIQSPVEAEAWLYEQVDQLRMDRGLPPVERFPLFERVVREHSAYMGAYGSAVHQVRGVTEGVSWNANNLAHPRAHHHESVAAAITAEDALFLMQDSPGHLYTLLCEECTHASIGVALEPVVHRFPRLFVTIDLLEFPQGPPQEISR